MVQSQATRYTGRVKWFNAKSGYGFITPDAGGQDVFLHVSRLRDAGIVRVEAGERLEYEIVEAQVAGKPGRTCAGNLTRLSPPSDTAKP